MLQSIGNFKRCARSACFICCPFLQPLARKFLPQATLCYLYSGDSGLIFPWNAVEIFVSFSLVFSPYHPSTHIQDLSWCSRDYGMSFHTSCFPLLLSHWQFFLAGGLICMSSSALLMAKLKNVLLLMIWVMALF